MSSTLSNFLLFIFGLLSAHISVAQTENNAFGLKTSQKECENLMVSENALTSVGNSLAVENGKVVLTYHNFEYINEIFKNPKDGLAIDLLTATQFACSMANKTNDSPIYEGTLLQPIYRAGLLKANTAKNEHRFIAEVGSVPENLRNETVVPAIIIIKNGYACHWSSPVQIPHKTFEPIPFELKTDLEPATPFLDEGVISSKQVFFQFKKKHHYYECS